MTMSLASLTRGDIGQRLGWPAALDSQTGAGEFVRWSPVLVQITPRMGKAVRYLDMHDDELGVLFSSQLSGTPDYPLDPS
jgi:hypothetical protein